MAEVTNNTASVLITEDDTVSRVFVVVGVAVVLAMVGVAVVIAITIVIMPSAWSPLLFKACQYERQNRFHETPSSPSVGIISSTTHIMTEE